jgi:hypothetical protein
MLAKTSFRNMKKTFKIILLAISLIGISACDNYLDINITPNNPTDVPAVNMMPGVQIGTSFVVAQNVNLVLGCWMQHQAGTGTQSAPYDVYQLPSEGDGEGAWNTVYATLLSDLKSMEAKTEAQKDYIHKGMAQVLSAYIWTFTTDLFGDIPFSEALIPGGKPKYDSQELVYTEVLKILDTAIENLGKTNAVASAAEGDLIYAGNKDKWIRAANALKLKVYIQMRHKKSAEAKQGIEALIAGGQLLTSNADNFQFTFGSIARAQNPIYQYAHLNRPGDLIVSTSFFDFMNGNQDPRMNYYFTSTNASLDAPTFVTYPNGRHFVTNFPGANTRSRWGAYVVGQGTAVAGGIINAAGVAPVRMLTASMVNFWLAEAVLTLGVTGDASAYFQAGVKASMDDVANFVPADRKATFNTNATTYNTTKVEAFNIAADNTSKLKMVIEEKWVSSVGNALESFNDFRRTGFPTLALAENAEIQQIPVRFPYPVGEINTNNANVPIKENRAGLTTKLWFMP